VNGRRIRINKNSDTNLSSIVWTGPENRQILQKNNLGKICGAGGWMERGKGLTPGSRAKVSLGDNI